MLWNIFARGYLKQLSVLAGLIVGYVAAIGMGKVDLSVIMADGIISLPKILPYTPEFHPGAIFSVCIIFLVSAAETIGDTSAVVSSGLNRAIEGKEISGSLACDGYVSAFSALLGCPPITSFSQNIGLVAMTKVVNRFTIMMFGTILISGFQMLAKAEFNHRNTVIASLSLAVGIGFTSSSESGLWNAFPPLVQSVFASNIVAVVFVVSIVLNLILPKNMELQQ